MKVRRADHNLSFTIDSAWAWSLRVYEEHRLIGIMQASSPFACLAKVEPFFAAGGEPKPPFKVLICCNANHRRLKLDRGCMARLADSGDGLPSDRVLEHLGDYFQRDLSKVADSTSITVMTAPATSSPTASAPASASSAMTSTPARSRRKLSIRVSRA